MPPISPSRCGPHFFTTTEEQAALRFCPSAPFVVGLTEKYLRAPTLFELLLSRLPWYSHSLFTHTASAIVDIAWPFYRLVLGGFGIALLPFLLLGSARRWLPCRVAVYQDSTAPCCRDVIGHSRSLFRRPPIQRASSESLRPAVVRGHFLTEQRSAARGP